MYDQIYKDFRKFTGQPVCVFTTDGRCYKGTVLQSYADSVRILDKKCNLVLLPYRHIDAIDEPRMFNNCEGDTFCHCSCKCNGNGSGVGGDYTYGNYENCKEECCD